MKQCQCQTADRFKQTINSSVNFCLGTSIEKLITLMYSKVPREDCQKVPENVCKPETRVKVVEVEEEVCEEVVTTPRTTTTTTTRAPVTKAVVEPGRSYILFSRFITQTPKNQLTSLSENSYLPPPPDTASIVDLRSADLRKDRKGRRRTEKKPRRGQKQGQGKKSRNRKGRRGQKQN